MHQVSKILFCHETLHVSAIYYAHHQELSAVHVAIDMFHAGYMATAYESHVGTPFQPDLDTWCTLLVVYTKIITMHGHLNIKYDIL